jgi:N-acyl-D-aspartate/D-glutamate deacylase
MFDTLIQGGTVIDGTGCPGFRADVALAGDRIAAIGDLRDAEARATVNAAGLMVAPGFVDVHNHDEAWLLKDPRYTIKLRQGFTSEILLSDGISYAPMTPTLAPEFILYWRALNGLEPADYTGWRSIADFMALLDGRTPCNTLPLIPYANVRVIAAGWGRAAPDRAAAARITQLIEEGMAQGAAGLSSGMDYVAQCYATTDELVAACRTLRPSGGLHVMHIRYQSGRLAALQEAVAIGRRAGVPVHVSHLMGRTTEESAALIDYIDRVAVREVDFSFDTIPYCSASTLLLSQLPIEAWEDGPAQALQRMRAPELRQRLANALQAVNLENYRLAFIPGGRHDRWFGQPLARYVEFLGQPPADAVLHLLAETNLAVLMVYLYGAGDAPAWPFLAHPCGMLGTDGIYFPGGHVHPRVYGCAARMLGDLVRRNLFTLEQAVHKMTGQPAARFGLANRGTLRKGAAADVVVFDPSRVRDRATYEDPHQHAEGIAQVWVNGTQVVADGAPIEVKTPPGRSLRYRQPCD